jgi:hypothetical protein
VKWWSWSTIGLTAEVCFIIHIVEIIRCYLLSTTVLKYDCCKNWRHLVEVMSRTNRNTLARYDFPYRFPSEEILKFHFRILTFPSVCSYINQSNYMQGGYFQKIWSILVQIVKWWSGSTISLIAEVCLSDSVGFNYSHCRNAHLLFGVNYSVEIRLNYSATI